MLSCRDRAPVCGARAAASSCLPAQWLPCLSPPVSRRGRWQVYRLMSSMWPRSGMYAADRRLCPVSDWGLGLVTGPWSYRLDGPPPPPPPPRLSPPTHPPLGEARGGGCRDGHLDVLTHTHRGAHLPRRPLSCHVSASLTASAMPHSARRPLLILQRRHAAVHKLK